MFSKIVPVAIVAFTALAAVGTASAHDVIVPRAGFDEALASLQQSASNTQSQSQSKTQAQNGASVRNSDGSTNVQVLNPSEIHDGWWKDR